MADNAAAGAQVANQSGALRAAEQNQRAAQLEGTALGAGTQYGQQATLGYGQQGQGLGYGIDVSGLRANIGQGIVGAGQAQTGQYLGALTDQEQAELAGRTGLQGSQLQSSMQNRANNQAFLGNMLQTGGTVFGAVYGGPAGAAAGGVAGRSVAGQMQGLGGQPQTTYSNGYVS
jgi:hypothetical protein